MEGEGSSLTAEQLDLGIGYTDEAAAEDGYWNASTNARFPQDEIIEAAFQHFREVGFPYKKLPLHMCMQEINRLAAMPLRQLLHTSVGYAVADSYHPHRSRASANGKRSPFESFRDDKLLKRALTLQMEQESTIPANLTSKISIVAGTQACSNFRPGFACSLYRRFSSVGDTVLDTSTGYGGRLIGFMASGVAGRYIGIDPATETYLGNLRMSHDLGYPGQVELIHAAAEDVDKERWANSVDFAFTSPPYFNKEIYSHEETQSWKRYQTPEEWRVGFLLPMLQLQFASLRDGAFAVINIENTKVGGAVIPLVDMTIKCGREAGFSYEGEERFTLQKRIGVHQVDAQAFERVLVFRKDTVVR